MQIEIRDALGGAFPMNLQTISSTPTSTTLSFGSAWTRGTPAELDIRSMTATLNI
jgi:hypothetical protein